MNRNSLKLLKKLSKSGNFKILMSLMSGSKRWSQLEKIVDKKTLSNSINELFQLGLIQATIIHDTPTGSKAYELTPIGKKIISLIEEMEKEFKEFHSNAPPKDPEKFINESLEKD